MAACEKCWSDARSMAVSTGKSIAVCYGELVEERRNSPCTPRQQAGQFWDEETGLDTRLLDEDATNDSP